MIMTGKPILFSTPMVRAILRGESPKTVTRRLVVPQPDIRSCRFVDGIIEEYRGYPAGHADILHRSPYKPGDRLWVRETWQHIEGASGRGYAYKAGGGVHNDTGKWRPSIHIPRAASRITLEVASVRAERLRDITEEDVRAEGVELYAPRLESEAGANAWRATTPRTKFCSLWDSLYAQRGFGWDTNPLVWRVQFRRVK